MRFREQCLASVIISNYNYGRFLAEAINSVLGQTYENIQLIVVDDGSTDASRSYLDEFRATNCETVYQENLGQAAAFNSGFRKCRGKFVAFLDSDDLWYPGKLEVCISQFEKGNISIVQHNLDVIGKDSVPIGKVHPGFPPGRLSLQDSFLAENHTGFFCPTSGIVCRKTDLDQIFPIDEAWSICADVAITRPLPLFGDILTLNETQGAYRIHGENTWMNSRDQENWVENQQKYVDYANSWLKRCGVTQNMDFAKSEQFHIYSRLQAEERRAGRRLKKAISRAVKKIPMNRFLSKFVRG